MGCVLVSKAVYDQFMQQPDGIEFFHGYTYSGHPVACAAGLATLGIYERDGLLTRAKSISRYWEDAAHSLKGSPHLIDIRNYGLIAALESEPIPGKPGARAFEIYREVLREGIVLVRQTGDIIALSPPLIVERRADGSDIRHARGSAVRRAALTPLTPCLQRPVLRKCGAVPTARTPLTQQRRS